MRGPLQLGAALVLLAACPAGPGTRGPAGPAAPASCDQVFPASLFGARIGKLDRKEARDLGQGQGRFYTYRRALDESGELHLTAMVLPAEPGVRLKQAFGEMVQRSMAADREQLGRDPKLLFDKSMSVSQQGRLSEGWHGRVLATPAGDPMGPSTVTEHYLFRHRGCMLKLRAEYPTVWQKKLAAEIADTVASFD